MRPARPKPRRVLFLVHSLCGLKLSLLLLFVCLTGTLAVLADEIDALVLGVGFSSAPGEASWGERHRAARSAFPQHAILYARAGEQSWLATQFYATGPAGDPRKIYVDPATAEVRGERNELTVRAFLRALHYYLFIPGSTGVYVVTGLSFLVLASATTGLALYRRFWRGFFRLPRLGAGLRVFWGDVHRWVGLWSSWFAVLIAATGIWYLAERILYDLGIDLEPPAAAVDVGALDRGRAAAPVPLPLDDMVARARAALPGLVVREISFPARLGEPLVVAGQASAWLVRDRANAVHLDPFTGAVLALRPVEAMTPLQRWVHTADPLHFGDFGGFPSKLAWVLFGAALCVLAASGVLIHAHRVGAALRPASAVRGRSPAMAARHAP